MFKKGKKHGQGVMFNKDKTKYEGAFKYGQKHGYGTLYAKDNKAISNGDWKRDKFVG